MTEQTRTSPFNHESAMPFKAYVPKAPYRIAKLELMAIMACVSNAPYRIAFGTLAQMTKSSGALAYPLLLKLLERV